VGKGHKCRGRFLNKNRKEKQDGYEDFTRLINIPGLGPDGSRGDGEPSSESQTGPAGFRDCRSQPSEAQKGPGNSDDLSQSLTIQPRRL
jgi:hypothetical protein